VNDGSPTGSSELCDTLAATAAARGLEGMFAELTASLAARQRWHSLFDARLMAARAALGLPLAGDSRTIPAEKQAALEAKSLDACREVGWPLVEEGKVAAGWMYLRAAVEPEEMGRRMAALAERFERSATTSDAPMADDDGGEQGDETLQEIIHVALWEGVDPALGLKLLLARNGTCNTITAYEQAVSRLPAARQRPAADLLVAHLHREVLASLVHDLHRRGIPVEPGPDASLTGVLEAAGGLKDDPAVHVDVSHLQSVLRIARVCTDHVTLRRAWELASYACRLPKESVYPGEPPFENVGEASRLFYGAQLGIEVEPAIAFFRKAAVLAKVEQAGSLPGDVLVLLLWRLARPAEALHAALDRPRDDAGPSLLQATGMLPSLVEMAAASGDFGPLRKACREHGDEITFAATLAAEHAGS
jgi:hypothetical protein